METLKLKGSEPVLVLCLLMLAELFFSHPQCSIRCGIALALNKLSQYLDESQVTPLFLFFVPDALNDRHADVRRCMLDAALSALNTHGKVQLTKHSFDLSHLTFDYIISEMHFKAPTVHQYNL